MGSFSSADTIWVLFGTALVFFMQAGFAMVETGFTRAKNAGNIILKNLMDLSLGTPVYWLVGFGLMFGAGPVIGWLDIGSRAGYEALGLTIPLPAFMIFQTVFCATAATIVSGAMAERTKFIAYCIYSVAISVIVYPISGHWIWGGGWLAGLGFHDFAGSTAVHLVGGTAALVGAKMLGPRIGKYDKDGNSKAILGHSVALGALGVFILWFCWFGFNGGSTISATGDGTLTSMGQIFVNTNMSAACAAISTMVYTWVKYKKPDISMTLNGALAGLVGVTAGCDCVSPFGALMIGLICGVAIVVGIEFVDKKLKIDDPVGAIGVHGICGALGTILAGFFSVEHGLLYGNGAGFLGTQLLGVVSVAAYVCVAMVIVFTLIKKTVGLRVAEDEELSGLDITEHGLASSYADFMPVNGVRHMPLAGGGDVDGYVGAAPGAQGAYGAAAAQSGSGMGHSQGVSGSGAGLGGAAARVSPDAAVPVVDSSSAPAPGEAKITKLSIVMQQSRFEIFKGAMQKIGVNGMTVTQALGYGMQKGSADEYYRGVAIDPQLLPKVQVDVVVCKVPVELVVETAKRALYTGRVGDGKIFIYDVENVVKVRTGEVGFDALQDD
ncbi:MAG: ammonium transporter [Clostridiales bacterium]|jgi:Amt family ammonium transporter|nr:ammonium transporter [Clostridiales bacterium]